MRMLYILALLASTYTIVLVPDTQNYTGTSDGGTAPDDTYARVTQWIARERSESVLASVLVHWLCAAALLLASRVLS